MLPLDLLILGCSVGIKSVVDNSNICELGAYDGEVSTIMRQYYCSNLVQNHHNQYSLPSLSLSLP